MKNTPLIAALGLAIIAGGAVASNDATGGKHHRPHHSFEELDANSDGALTQDEIAAHMQARFQRADTDSDGLLTQAELVARAGENRKKRAEKFVTRMIEKHDVNGDGALSFAEMSKRHDGKMFAQMDADQNGAVTKEEFDAMRAKHKAHKRKGHGNEASDDTQ